MDAYEIDPQGTGGASDPASHHSQIEADHLINASGEMMELMTSWN